MISDGSHRSCWVFTTFVTTAAVLILIKPRTVWSVYVWCMVRGCSHQAMNTLAAYPSLNPPCQQVIKSLTQPVWTTGLEVRHPSLSGDTPDATHHPPNHWISTFELSRHETRHLHCMIWTDDANEFYESNFETEIEPNLISLAETNSN